VPDPIIFASLQDNFFVRVVWITTRHLTLPCSAHHKRNSHMTIVSRFYRFHRLLRPTSNHSRHHPRQQAHRTVELFHRSFALHRCLTRPVPSLYLILCHSPLQPPFFCPLCANGRYSLALTCCDTTSSLKKNRSAASLCNFVMMKYRLLLV